MHILLADEDQSYLDRLQEMILRDCATDGEMIVDRASSVNQVLHQLSGNGFDVCFLDNAFGNRSGVDILRSIDPLDLRTAVIFLASHGEKEAAYTALSLGAMDFLIKAQLDSFGLVKSLAFSLFRKSREMELRSASLRDVLTGLGNRTLFREQASKLVQHAKRERNNVAVLFLDVDGLKPVNDSFGHPVGDQVLKQIAQRLQERTRESDIVARVGGDEFLVLLGRIDSPESALKVGADLSRAISQKIFAVDGHAISVGLSCGTALFPQDSEHIDDLIRLADQRMYDVKALTKSRRSGGQLVWGR